MDKERVTMDLADEELATLYTALKYYTKVTKEMSQKVTAPGTVDKHGNAPTKDYIDVVLKNSYDALRLLNKLFVPNPPSPVKKPSLVVLK